MGKFFTHWFLPLLILAVSTYITFKHYMGDYVIMGIWVVVLGLVSTIIYQYNFKKE